VASAQLGTEQVHSERKALDVDPQGGLRDEARGVAKGAVLEERGWAEMVGRAVSTVLKVSDGPIVRNRNCVLSSWKGARVVESAGLENRNTA
jgi:hypothetical protein